MEERESFFLVWFVGLCEWNIIENGNSALRNENTDLRAQNGYKVKADISTMI